MHMVESPRYSCRSVDHEQSTNVDTSVVESLMWRTIDGQAPSVLNSIILSPVFLLLSLNSIGRTSANINPAILIPICIAGPLACKRNDMPGLKSCCDSWTAFPRRSHSNYEHVNRIIYSCTPHTHTLPNNSTRPARIGRHDPEKYSK